MPTSALYYTRAASMNFFCCSGELLLFLFSVTLEKVQAEDEVLGWFRAAGTGFGCSEDIWGAGSVFLRSG